VLATTADKGYPFNTVVQPFSNPGSFKNTAFSSRTPQSKESCVMASFNKVILLGNVTRDPELRYIANGTAVTDIGLAVNDRRKTATGEWVEETTFVDVTLWDGKKNSKLRVVCDRMQLLGSRSGGEGRPGDAPRGRGRPAAPGRGGPANAPSDEYDQSGGYDVGGDIGASVESRGGEDDIPF
jgi:single-strand DNA-binding protein